MATKIPFIESPSMRSMAHIFHGVGDILLKIMPKTEMTLRQSGVSDEYKITARIYLSLAFVGSFSAFSGISLLMTGLLYLGEAETLLVGPIFGALVGFVMFFYMLGVPSSIVSKRVKYIERNLLFALRSILVQIRSGVPIFNTLVSVSASDYGPISHEFKNVIEKVNAGQSMVRVLEELAVRNPSAYFRRALWQMVNSIKSGSDVGDNLEGVIRSLSKEQLVEIRRYKSVLNPLAMMYMMVAVIMPSLGITMLIILSSFPGMEAVGNEQSFYALLAFAIFMQFIFMGIIKSKRPNLIGG